MRISRAADLALVAALFVHGCGGPSPSPSPAAPASAQATQATAPTQAPTTAPAAAEVDALVSSMAAAVRAGDRAAYLALVDLSDPTFELEHTRWADDWSGPNPASEYSLQIAAVEIDDHLANGRLTVTWKTAQDLEPRTATFVARFTGGAGHWRYAGEAWVATDAPHFRVLVAPGLEDTVPGIVADLPGIYDLVTTTLDAAPNGSMEIKVYADAPALVANTLLSLPNIRGWNEPGEALKLWFDRDNPDLAFVVAHEFTHYVCFDRAGTQRTRMPWWLDEGIATFVAAVGEPPERAAERLAPVIAWAASGQLAPWANMAVFEETPLELWEFAYPQGYAMVAYITERFGAAARNAWLAAMATKMAIDEATPAELGLSFDELDADFRKWLATH